jgi:putative transposase
MSRPSRPSNPEDASGRPRTFFVTTSTAAGRPILQSDRMAELLIDVLRSCVRESRFAVHEFVVMPNHLHALITIPGTLTVERAMQLIKGRFSFRARKELGFPGEVWQRGFSDVRITDEASFRQHLLYIGQNPVSAGLAEKANEFPYGSAYLKKMKRAGAEAQSS